MDMNVTVVGGGSWGSALSLILADNNHTVKLYDLNEALIDEINTKHTNETYLPGATLPERIIGYTHLAEALEGSDFVLTVVPTKVMRLVLKEINQVLQHPVTFINAS